MSMESPLAPAGPPPLGMSPPPPRPAPATGPAFSPFDFRDFFAFVATGVSAFSPLTGCAPSANRSSVASSLSRLARLRVSVIGRQSSVVSRHSDVCFDLISLLFHPLTALLGLALRHEHVEELEGLVLVLDPHFEELAGVRVQRRFPQLSRVHLAQALE